MCSPVITTNSICRRGRRDLSICPALAVIVAGSRHRAAHKLPVQTLRRVFAVLLYALATKMVVT